MKLRLPLLFLPALLLSASSTFAADEPPAFTAGIAFLQKHCFSCHGGEKREAELRLDGYRDAASIAADRKKWETLQLMVEGGQMPPEDQPRPAPQEIEQFLELVAAVFDHADRNAKPDPGRVTMRRLNKVEYANTVRDLTGIDFNPAEDFPSDDVGHGFDNIGDVLSLSPVLMERYLAAAETIAERAIVPSPVPPPQRHLSARYTEPAGGDVIFRDEKGGWREISSQKTDNIRHSGPVFTGYQVPNGEYIFRSRLYADAPEGATVKVVILACSPELKDGAATDEQAAAIVGAADSLRPFVIVDTIEIKARKPEEAQRIEVTINGVPKLSRVAIGLMKPAEGQPDQKLFIQNFHLTGPSDTRPDSHRQIMACRADASKAEQTREILTRLATRAYRRPVKDDELARLTRLVEQVEQSGGRYEEGIQFALQALLVSPRFLFRAELDSSPGAPEIRPLDEYQLASRLSYFLWSSMPDDELLSLAGRGELTQNLDAQVLRMLQSPKAAALIDNFALQWLQLKRLETFTPDASLFPSFNDSLRRSMLQETRLFLEAVMKEDRSVLDLLQADFTFLNETLARHYGIADTNGNPAGQKPVREKGESIPRRDFVRINLTGDRGGLLTMASILTVTSNPTRTSPVKRGRWVLEQMLGAPPPPPPPNVPELEAQKDKLTGSLRQRMEQHRKNPACAMCHTKMDALGFAFENFNAIGQFRSKDGEYDIDPAGTLPGNISFSGPAQLKQILKDRREPFVRCLTEKMLIYALGRGLENYDRPVVIRITQEMAKNNDRFSTLVTEIVRSEPFRLRRGL